MITSGNLSFLNWLTILPSLACFDDQFLQSLFNKSPKSTLWNLVKHQYLESIGKFTKTQSFISKSCGFCYYSKHLLHNSCISMFVEKRFRNTINLLLLALIAYLSMPVVVNLLSPNQMMNTSFEPFRIVNTYGAFGRYFCFFFRFCFDFVLIVILLKSITKTRHEVVFKGTHSLDPNDQNATWKEYEFKCKPGSVTRRPCVITPYHYRLDWLMWFAAFQVCLKYVYLMLFN